jgi:hypothetical protein
MPSEAQMFRVVVVCGACAAIVVGAALAIDPLAGAIVLAFEVAAGAWLALDRFRKR